MWQNACVALIHFILATKENPYIFPNLFILGWRVEGFESKVSMGEGKEFSLNCTPDFKVYLKEEGSFLFINQARRGSVHSETSELRRSSQGRQEPPLLPQVPLGSSSCP